MVKAAELLGVIEEANSAQIAFGEMRYWMTDLAVSMLMLVRAQRRTQPARAWSSTSTRSRGTAPKPSPQCAASWRNTRNSPTRQSMNTPTTIG